MERNEILATIKKILAPYIKDKDQLGVIKDDTHITIDLHINSAHVIDIILDVESEFGIIIDDNSMGKITTVGSCIDVITQKI